MESVNVTCSERYVPEDINETLEESDIEEEAWSNSGFYPEQLQQNKEETISNITSSVDEGNLTDDDLVQGYELISVTNVSGINPNGTKKHYSHSKSRAKRQITEPLFKPKPTAAEGRQPPWKFIPKASFPKEHKPELNPKYFQQLDEVITMDLILTVGRNISSWDDLAAHSDFMEIVYAALLTVQAGLNQHMGSLGMEVGI